MIPSLTTFARRVIAALHRSAREREMAEEMEFHVTMEAADLVSAGMPADDAHARARAVLGGATRFLEEERDARLTAAFERLARETRVGLRRLWRERSFTVPVVVTLGAGLGAVTAIFALANGVIFRPLPYSRSERLVAIGHLPPAAGVGAGGTSEAELVFYASNGRSFESVAGYYSRPLSLTGGAAAERVSSALVTPAFFTVLGVAPERGRDCSAWSFKDWNIMSDSRIVLISHDLWVRRYGGDPSVVGRTVDELNRMPMTIAGVMPARFHFPRAETALWYCWPVDTLNPGLGTRNLTAIARLRPDAQLATARADMRRLDALARARYATREDGAASSELLTATALPLSDVVVSDVRSMLLFLVSAALLLLIVAWANVGNLFLTRAERRQQLVAVERAIGASEWDLARRSLVEGVLVSTAGGVLAFVIAGVAVASHFGFDGGQIPRLDEVHVDGGLLTIVVGLAIASGLTLGLISFTVSHRVGAAQSLAPILATMRTTASRQWRRGAQLLMVVQLALALGLLVGSVAMLESYANLRNSSVGFDPANVLAVDLSLPARGYARYADIARFYSEVADQARHLPGVRQAEVAGGSMPLSPLQLSEYWNVLRADDLSPGSGALRAPIAAATPGWFAAMRVPLLLGRTFRSGDLTGAAPVILSQSLARALFGDADPIGRRIRVGTSKWDEPVIGVVGDLPGASVADGPMRTIYFPLLDDLRATPSVRPSTPLFPAEVSLFVRTNDEDAAALIPAIRRIVREIDPHVPVSRPRMLSDVVAASVARSRLTTILLLLGACATLLLGVVGVYGVTSYVVAARTRELSIQMALGATSSAVRMRVVRQHIGSTCAGVVVGIGVALALTRLLRGLLYQVSPADPTTLAAAALSIMLVAALASWLPSRRVARLDIVNALRGE